MAKLADSFLSIFFENVNLSKMPSEILPSLIKVS